MKLPRRKFLHVAIGAAGLPMSSCFAWAQGYPTRPVRVIVPFPAGGSTDAGARIIAEYLSRVFGRQFFIENRSGAGGNIGIEAAAKSPPDGYTLLVSTDHVASSPHAFKLNIDPLKDLAPVIQLSRQPVVLAVHPSLGVNSVAELITVAKQQPGLNYALGGGAGGQQHIVVEWFAHIAGIKLAQVAYRGGAPALNDLIAGHVKIRLVDAADPTLQGGHTAIIGAVDSRAVSRPARCADLSRSGYSRACTRPVGRRVCARGDAASNHGPPQCRDQQSARRHGRPRKLPPAGAGVDGRYR